MSNLPTGVQWRMFDPQEYVDWGNTSSNWPVWDIPTTEAVMVVNDFQIPYHDPTALSVVEQVMADVVPDIVIYLGDIFDFPSLSSKFRKYPEQRYRLWRDIKLGKGIFTRHRGILPAARFIFVEGNHEARLGNYVVDNADELTDMLNVDGGLSLPKLIGADELGIEYLGPYGAAFEHRSFIFKHGERITQFSAAAELRAEGTSGISAHTHKGGSAYSTNRSGAHAWYENFCLCHTEGVKRPPSSLVQAGPVNWQQGFSIIYFDGGIFNVYPVVITHGQCVWGGKRYTA